MVRAGQRAPYQATFAVLLVGVAAYALLQSLVLPVLPTIQHSLHTSQSAVTWVLTAYLLSASVFYSNSGRVGDMVGKKRIFVVALAALALGSLLAALATSIGVMIVARAIQGVGGGVLPLAFGIIRDEFPPQKLGSAVGTTAALRRSGGGFGIVLAGPIIKALNYHWLFWIPMIMVVAAGLAAHFLVPESPVRTPGRINWTAAVLLAAWLVALLVAVTEGPSWGWASPRVLGLFVAAVVFLLVWIWVELRAAEPLIDMRMMRLPAVWTTNLVAFLFGVCLYSALAFLPEFLQTPASAGYGFGASCHGVRFVLASPCCSDVRVRDGVRPPRRTDRSRSVLIIGSATSIFPFVLLAVAHDHEWQIFLATTVLGAGFGLAFSAMSSIIVGAVPACTDRRRERDEREHPHDRRVDRRSRHGEHRDLGCRRRRLAEGIRVHRRVRDACGRGRPRSRRVGPRAEGAQTGGRASPRERPALGARDTRGRHPHRQRP